MKQTPPVSRTYAALLKEQAARYGSNEAVVGAGQRLTYSQLREQVLVVARGLIGLGVRRGDHVAILMGNRPEWVVSFLAIHQVGATVVALNTWSTPRELEYALEHSDTSVLISAQASGSHDYRATLSQVCERLPKLRRIVWMAGKKSPANGEYTWDDWAALGCDVTMETAEARGDEVDRQDIAFLLYSSGSTAAPKGILLRHGDAIENGWNIGERQHVTDRDRLWLVVSLFWSFGSVNATTNLMTHGGCLCLQERFEPGEALALIERERCTIFYGTPNMAYSMRDHADRPNRDLSSLRSGAAIGTPEQLACIVELGVREICCVYGLTETYGNCTVTDASDPLDLRLRSVGKALPGVEIRICDMATGRTLPDGEVGEIRIKGYLLAGYYKDEVRTQASLDEDGFLRSGDLGMKDATGRVFYHGRITEMVKCGGINVAPVEVEEILMRHPDVLTAYVIGVPDPVVDQVLAAVIVTAPAHPTPSAEALKTMCRRELAAYKVPALYRFVRQDQLPLTTTGKMQKLRLSTLFSEEHAGQ